MRVGGGGGWAGESGGGKMGDNCTWTTIKHKIKEKENHKDFTIKLWERINELSKVAGYKINIQKLVAVLYTNSELSEWETMNTILFLIASKKR